MRKKLLLAEGYCPLHLGFLMALFVLYFDNDAAEWSKNRYNNELSKAGIFSFFRCT